MQANNNGQIMAQGPQRQQITAKEFAAKYNSKRECYNFLTVDASVDLPSYD